MRKWLAVLWALVAFPAYADIEKPQAIDPYIHSDIPYGEGTLTKLFLDVYDAAVWTDDKVWSMDSTYALELIYHMNFKATDLADRSIEEMNQQEPLTSEQAGRFRDALARVFPNVRKGDNITALYRPKKGVLFFYNNRPTGMIADQSMARRFMGIWLSPKTSEPKLRSVLVRSGE